VSDPEPLAFAVGDRVLKHAGCYHLAGVVVAAFHTKAGRARYVVEADCLPGLLMIYNGDQLRRLDP
jgi:hypothetical protein